MKKSTKDYISDKSALCAAIGLYSLLITLPFGIEIYSYSLIIISLIIGILTTESSNTPQHWWMQL